MKPNYNSYSRHELRQAINAIDRQTYPERLAEMQALLDSYSERELDNEIIGSSSGKAMFQLFLLNASVAIVGTCIVLFILITKRFDYLRGDAFILFLSPIALLFLPNSYKKLKKKRTDITYQTWSFGPNGIKHILDKQQNVIHWESIKRIEYYRARTMIETKLPVMRIYDQSGAVVAKLTPAEFNFDKEQLLEYLQLKGQLTGFTCQGDVFDQLDK